MIFAGGVLVVSFQPMGNEPQMVIDTGTEIFLIVGFSSFVQDQSPIEQPRTRETKRVDLVIFIVGII